MEGGLAVTYIPLIVQLITYAIPLGFGIAVIVLLYKIYKRLGEIERAVKSDAREKDVEDGREKE